uniref:Refilin A n=2 Tax=Felinae TaxID=338152 RepID=A0A667IAC2_LYNCA
KVPGGAAPGPLCVRFQPLPEDVSTCLSLPADVSQPRGAGGGCCPQPRAALGRVRSEDHPVSASHELPATASSEGGLRGPELRPLPCGVSWGLQKEALPTSLRVGVWEPVGGGAGWWVGSRGPCQGPHRAGFWTDPGLGRPPCAQWGAEATVPKGCVTPCPWLSPQPPALPPSSPALEMRPRMLPVSFGESIEVHPEPTHEIRCNSEVKYASERHFRDNVFYAPVPTVTAYSETIVAAPNCTWRNYRSQLTLEPRPRALHFRSTTIIFPKRARNTFRTTLHCSLGRPSRRFTSSVQLQLLLGPAAL